MQDITTIRRNNLRELISQYPSQVAFATAVEKSPQQIGGMLNGSKSFGNRIARDIEEKLGLKTGYLDQASNDNQFVRISRLGDPNDCNWVRIPLLDIEASCGGGIESSLPSIVGGVDLAPEFLLSLPGVISPRHLHVVNAHGDSMEPTVMDKAFCVIDTAQTRILADGIYCLCAENQIFIKRLQRNLDGTLLLISDNPRYHPQTIDKLTLEERTTIVGRVVYVYNGSPL